ncbi:MAG: hypothetical protein QXU40_03665 [Candidatus Pacearchaeota archaeon]
MTEIEKCQLAGFIFGLILGIFIIIFHKSITDISIRINERFFGNLLLIPPFPKLNEFLKNYSWLLGGITLSIMSLLAILSILRKK